MARKQFRIRVIGPDTSFGPARSRRGTLKHVTRRLKNHPAPYRVKTDGAFKHPRNLQNTRTKLRSILDTLDEGESVVVKAADEFALRIQCISSPALREPAPDGAAGFWHNKVINAYERVFGSQDFSGRVTFLGAFNCRKMRNSNSWSMHSDWPPVLAIDFGTGVDQELQDQLESFLKKNISGLVIVTGRDNSLHRDHIHVQVGPNRAGTPACA